MINAPEVKDETPVFTVHQLNQTARTLLEKTFQLAWVKGELSGVKLHHSGHLYFTLKDAQAQIKGVMFRGSNRKLDFKPEDGLEVLVRANVTIYEQGGSYQLNVVHMEKSGVGQLQQAFEALKAKLQAEGLFEASRKKALPRFPRHIGIITSHTGAALQDILTVLKRRYPIAPITVYHTQVQGKGAALEIAKAIKYANEHNSADVLVVGRGGGSLEDLWCFNEEVVARAIAESRIPTVSAVGHEVDFTIADFVADVRAPTPSAAAETIVPDSVEVIRLFQQYLNQMTQAIQRQIQHLSLKVDILEKRLISPKQRLDKALQQAEHLLKRLTLAIDHRLQRAKNALQQASAQLNAVSPLATLERGYAIVMTEESQEIIRSVKQVQKGQVLTTKLKDGEFKSQKI
jgi:exodeoxyribonuclease VII large subunit